MVYRRAWREEFRLRGSCKFVLSMVGSVVGFQSSRAFVSYVAVDCAAGMVVSPVDLFSWPRHYKMLASCQDDTAASAGSL